MYDSISEMPGGAHLDPMDKIAVRGLYGAGGATGLCGQLLTEPQAGAVRRYVPPPPPCLGSQTGMYAGNVVYGYPGYAAFGRGARSFNLAAG